MTTYRTVILVHEVVRPRYGLVSRSVTRLECLGVEEVIERVDCDVWELGHWFSLSVEGHQSVPRNAIVMVVTTGDYVFSRDKEGEL